MGLNYGWTGSFSWSTWKLREALEKPFPVLTPCTALSLASSPDHLLAIGGSHPPHLLPVTAQKVFFLLSACSRGCEKRAGSPNGECRRLQNQQQQELQFPVSEVLATSMVRANTLFRYSGCQDFKPSTTELVRFSQAYNLNKLDGFSHGQHKVCSSCQCPSHLQQPTCQTIHPCFKVGKLEGYQWKVNC